MLLPLPAHLLLQVLLRKGTDSRRWQQEGTEELATHQLDSQFMKGRRAVHSASAWCLLLLLATFPGGWQWHPHESKPLPYSLVNSVCLWVQECLNQCAPETLHAMV